MTSKYRDVRDMVACLDCRCDKMKVSVHIGIIEFICSQCNQEVIHIGLPEEITEEMLDHRHRVDIKSNYY
jgi:hypothetical protein